MKSEGRRWKRYLNQTNGKKAKEKRWRKCRNETIKMGEERKKKEEKGKEEDGRDT